MKALVTLCSMYVRQIKRKLLPVTSAQIGRFRIATTPNHALPDYMRGHLLYDQFIPALCKSIEGAVVDIGANIGDTMAAILDSNPKLKVICAEPDSQFFSILEKNRAAIDSGGQVSTFNVFVSSQAKNFKVLKNASGSTGHIEQVSSASNTAKTVSFGQLIDQAFVASPALVKSDTDGFDADILSSIADRIEKDSSCSPILFFEMQSYLLEAGFCDHSRQERQQEYFRVIERLRGLGYTRFLLLDNYGAPIIRHHDLDVLRSIEGYLVNSQTINGHVAMYFMDVVLYKESHAGIVNEALATLLSNHASAPSR